MTRPTPGVRRRLATADLLEPRNGRTETTVTTERSLLAAVRGWAGPGRLATGCVYNRRFENGPPEPIIEHIGNMVFA